MLSMKAEFVQVPRPLMEPGQGHYWTLNMNLTGDKRVRKRRSRAPSAAGSDHQDEDHRNPRPPSPFEPQEGSSLWGGHGPSPTGSRGRHMTRNVPYKTKVAPKQRSRSGASTSRYRDTLRRSESDTNLLANVESLNITRAKSSAGGMHPPPLPSQHRSYAGPSTSTQMASYGTWKPPQSHFDTGYFSSQESITGVQRPSFLMRSPSRYSPIISSPIQTGYKVSPAGSATSSTDRLIGQPMSTMYYSELSLGASNSAPDLQGKETASEGRSDKGKGRDLTGTSPDRAEAIEASYRWEQ
ncbi:hypothetical protein F5890DRAFT_816906 [Lentinula detonsa]|uniref:Fork-head domain-containing protein n=1 Tax=Lentinula detonsa TaxID=2804962 RepID=A0AA38PRE7_9AGAR|nr:hypothetical protein F5890DRAFT_816906 [Lentinula detonsa]